MTVGSRFSRSIRCRKSGTVLSVNMVQIVEFLQISQLVVAYLVLAAVFSFGSDSFKISIRECFAMRDDYIFVRAILPHPLF